MHLGISSWTYTWAVGVPGHLPARPLRPVDLVERAAGLGVRVLQICDNLPLHEQPPQEVEALHRRAQELGVSLELGTRGIAPEHLRRYLGLAEQLGASLLRVVVDTPERQPSPEEIIDTLHNLTGELEGAGLTLAIENHDRFRARDLARIIERVDNPHVGICLDTVNSFGALEGPEVVVAALAPLTVNLHLKDFDIRRANHSMGFVIEGRPAGRGRLDIPWLLEAMRGRPSGMSAILEQWTPPEASLDETIAKEAAWAAASIAYLRRLIPD